MINHYLHIEKGTFSWSDGVFSGIATVSQDKVSDFCLDQADQIRNSSLIFVSVLVEITFVCLLTDCLKFLFKFIFFGCWFCR